MKVVIVGAGFGGVRAALLLANKPGFRVQLVSDKTYFEYHAALYRSATGRSPLEVAIPLREFFSFAKNVEVIEDSISTIKDEIYKIEGSSGSKYSYDSLILSVGSVTQFFGISGLNEYSYGVKTIHEALELKRHLHESTIGGKETEKNYVVVGAGPSGVELAAEMKSYIEKVRKKHKAKNTPFNINLVEAASRVLPSMPESFSKNVEERLRKLKITLHLETAVKGETYDSIQLPDQEIKSRTVVWTAGLANNPLFEQNKTSFELNKRGKVVVNDFLEAAKDIYVIGDSADTKYSGMAQTALYDANFVVNNLLKLQKQEERKPYVPKRPIYAIPVGPKWSAVLWGKKSVFGFPAWVLRRLADLRLYLTFLTVGKALSTWRYGFVEEESCPICHD